MFPDKIRIENYIPKYMKHKPLHTGHVVKSNDGRFIIEISDKKTFPDRIWKNVKEGPALFQICNEKETYQFATGVMFEDLLPAFKPYANFSNNKLMRALKHNIQDENFNGTIDGVELSDLMEMMLITLHVNHDSDKYYFLQIAYAIWTTYILWIEQDNLHICECPLMNEVMYWNAVKQSSRTSMRNLYNEAFLDDTNLSVYSSGDVNMELYRLKMRSFMGNTSVQNDSRVTGEELLTQEEQDLMYDAIDSDVLQVIVYEDGIAIPTYNTSSESIHLFSTEELKQLCTILEKLHKHTYQHVRELHKDEYIQNLRRMGLL